MSTLVQREDRDGLAILTLNRPDKLNALTVAQAAQQFSGADILGKK